jgi:hypothetical protein
MPSLCELPLTLIFKGMQILGTLLTSIPIWGRSLMRWLGISYDTSLGFIYTSQDRSGRRSWLIPIGLVILLLGPLLDYTSVARLCANSGSTH